MRKHIYTLVVTMIAVSLFTTPIFANGSKQATVNESSMYLNGERIENIGFNVGGNNYFKLRDVAGNLSESTSQFEVGWNSEKNVIEIVTGEPYTPTDGGKAQWYYPGKNYYGTLQNTKFLVDGKEHNLPVFNIDGSNYFKLRDLSELVNFDMEWDNINGRDRKSVV